MTIIITCGVLASDFRNVLNKLQWDAEMICLPGGLHEDPKQLRKRLQEEIDKVDARQPDRVVLGYGVCGHGTVGLTARRAPLILPKVHDCIALFLGSDKRYNEQFSKNPGTYYVSAGWVEEKTEPINQPKADRLKPGPSSREAAELIEHYGEENAEAIQHFMSSWQRNYSRAAFINTGVGGNRERYEALARDMAERFGWDYEHLAGSHALLERIIRASETSKDVLVVPPGETTYYDSVRKVLACAGTDDMEQGHIPFNPSSTSIPPHPHTDAELLTLGIDAGGTYTDAAVFKQNDRTVLASAKAPTTRWDLSIGIREVLQKLPKNLSGEIGLVCLSTTLATNAIVENQGQKVGLIVMPPYGKFDTKRFNHEPIVAIKGRLEIDGSLIEEIDPDQVRRVAKQLSENHHVAAFAIAGYASHANPQHEQAVARLVEETTGKPVSCGYEVSAGLNYRIKAETAALNARIIPCLETLLKKVETTLAAFGVNTPIMVVKSNGSLMNISVALKHPVQTIMSGPAASVAGAVELSRESDAWVVDIGGTTTDTALVANGAAATDEQGATVGKWRTHVHALEMRTLGLGGDSRIALRANGIRIGPQRVLPICRAMSYDIESCLSDIAGHIEFLRDTPEALDILILQDTEARMSDLNAREKRIVAALKQSPGTRQGLAHRLSLENWRLLNTKNLESRGIVLRCGLTPTDLLHASGRLSLWDTDAAKRVCGIFAAAAGQSVETWIEHAHTRVVRKLARALIKSQLSQTIEPDAIDDCAPAQRIVDSALGAPLEGLKINIRLSNRIIGIGAPAACFVPDAAEMLRTTAIIPDHAEAANAVGAAASHVLVRSTASITTDETSQYRVTGLSGAPKFASIDEAEHYAITELTKRVRASAIEAGTSARDVKVAYGDSKTNLDDGRSLFIERKITVSIDGAPDLAER